MQRKRQDQIIVAVHTFNKSHIVNIHVHIYPQMDRVRTVYMYYRRQK